MVININKSTGMTSHDVVDAMRKITGEKKVGHAGTLDPFASGVLLVAIGRKYTKKLGDITSNTDKEYIAILELGKMSDTGDPAGAIKQTATTKTTMAVTGEQMKHMFQTFTGEIIQTPPIYSAVRVHGVRAYKLARQGKVIEMPKRVVSVYEIELLAFRPPLAKIRVVCSSGTYIRALAQDIGEKLGVGAYLIQLTRTRVGEYKIEDSKTLETLTQEFN
jgi:tRNA pseudouridine55 synthase